jgi:predicted nucleotidyltransferase component of viral defense system
MIDGSVGDAMVAMVPVLAAAREHAELPSLELTEGDTPSILYVGPLRAGTPRRIKFDVSDSEVVDSIEQRTMLAGLWPDLPALAPFDVYPASEIAAEKLRCIIQRVQCRDLYDILRLVEDLDVDLTEVRPLFERKAEAKNINPASFEARFEDRLNRYKSRWEAEMREHVINPPRFDDVVRVVRRHLRSAGMIDN